MFYRLLLISLLSLGVFGSVSAQTYWLNVVTDDKEISIPTSSEQRCTEALFRYVQQQNSGCYSCDIEPLPSVHKK
jgi:hypothetical protein